MKPTLVSIRYHEISGQRFHHGDEIPPGTLNGELLDWWLENGWCRGYPERRSINFVEL